MPLRSVPPAVRNDGAYRGFRGPRTTPAAASPGTVGSPAFREGHEGLSARDRLVRGRRMADPTPEPDAVAPTASAVPPPDAGPKEDWETRFKYLLADFENFRRRSTKEREGAVRQARGALLRELLPLLEAFRAATEAAGHLPAHDPIRRGFELLDREWSTFLKREGVEPVTEVGQPFRADEAEAVGEVAPDATAPEGAVHEIVQQGYRFFGGLLRPAKVIVARAPAPAAPAAGAAASPEGPPGAEP